MEAVYPAAASALSRGRRSRAAVTRARRRTLPVTFAEIKEVDEDIDESEQVAAPSQRRRRLDLLAPQPDLLAPQPDLLVPQPDLLAPQPAHRLRRRALAALLLEEPLSGPPTAPLTVSATAPLTMIPTAPPAELPTAPDT